MIFYVLAGLAAGICAGLYFPVYIPPEYGKMLSVALMAALDTAFGGIRSSMEGSYDFGETPACIFMIAYGTRV